MNTEQVTRIFDVIYYQQANFPKKDAFTAKINGEWIGTSTEEAIEQINLVSKGLLELGINPGDKIAMISNNRPEWCIVDYGIAQIGAINVPVYPTIAEEDYKFIFNDSEVKVCIVSDDELLTKVENIKDQVPSLKHLYSFDQIERCSHWSDIKEKGKSGDQEKVEAIKKEVKATDLATLIYTSGTTGVPKGVMLSHQNIVMNAVSCIPRLPVGSTAKSLSFLPVCHIYERMLLYLYAVTGVSVYFAESIDTIGDNLREVKPQVFTAVPRLLEKVYDKIIAKGSDLTGIKRALFFWAVNLGQKFEPYGANGGWYEFQLKIARKLIFSKWQEALGGNVLAVASGSAALQPRLARVFLAAGIPVMEGYGLTETSPVISVNEDENKGTMIGTVGRIIDNVEVKIAEDGEILTKGPCVMMGYYNREDLTKEVIDEDGWFHTGDIGTFVGGNKDFLKITDRKKEMFKTSGGKYIAPQLMENKFKESRFIEQIMVIGEGEKHPSALICPDFEFLKGWCERKELKCESPSDMVQNQQVIDRIWKEIEEFNSGFGKWEQIKKMELIDHTWSIDTGELTPTLKLKRKVIKKKYEALIEKIYRP